jgi:hypothetical protein
VARAATAAPTYFTPAHIRTLPAAELPYSLIDGGVFANNPALCAYAAARRLYPRARRFTIVDMMLDGQADQVSCLPAALPEVRLFRLNFRLEPGRAALDDGDNLVYLEQSARDWARQHRGTLDQICRELHAMRAHGKGGKGPSEVPCDGARSAA